MVTKHRPIFPINLGKDEFIETAQLLEELELSYTGLYSRIQRNGFPKPTFSGHNGKEALYDRHDVLMWLLKHNYRIMDE